MREDTGEWQCRKNAATKGRYFASCESFIESLLSRERQENGSRITRGLRYYLASMGVAN